MLADADQRDPVRRNAEVGQPGEDLRELELVVEVGLEPEDVLAVAAGGELAVTRLEVAPRPLDGRRVGANEEARADRAQLGVVDVRDRPLMERVAPDDEARGEARRAQRDRGRVAVGDVERRRVLRQLLDRKSVV